MSTHQGGIRLNQAQVVNSAGQIITSQNILTNQAIMQAMANLQMQQGIPIATAAGHQQILNQGQAQMPAIFAGQNFLIRTQAPLQQQQPITINNIQAAAFTAGIKPQTQQQPQQQQIQQQQVQGQQQVQSQQAAKGNSSGKIILPSVPRTPATAKIQPSVSQPNKVSVPAMPRQPKARPTKTQQKLPGVMVSVSPLTSPTNKTSTSAPVVTGAATSTPPPPSGTPMTAVVMSLPHTTVAQSPTFRQCPVPLAPASEESEAIPTATATTATKQHPNMTQAPPLAKPAETQQLKSPPPPIPVTSAVCETSMKVTSSTTLTTTTTTTTTTVSPFQTSTSGFSPVSTPTVVPAIVPKVSPVEETADSVKTKVDDIVIEEKPRLLEPVAARPIPAVVDPLAMEAAGLTTVIKESKPLGHTIPVVERQRAIVKPQILTHFIEGFIIQEGLEPFPVQQSSLLQEFIPPKASLQIVKESEEEATSYDDEPPTLLSQVDAHLSSTQHIGHFPQRQDEMDQKKSPVKLLKCEMCQKVGPVSTFNNSRRFCSLTCSRRHSVSHSRRVGIYKSRGTASKRKHILGRKHWRLPKGGRLPFGMMSGNNKNNNNEDSNTAPVGDELSSSNSAQDTSSSATSPSRSQDFEMDIEANIPSTDPGKWTVTEVYEFIQSMPGCREYAEEFRSQEIDGQALLLLKEDHLMTAMNIKLGPALKICSKINSLKSENAAS